MKRTKIIVCAALLCLLLAAALYFLIPAGIVEEGGIKSLTAVNGGEYAEISDEAREQVTALLEQARARRCFAPAQLYEEDGSLELNIVTEDGPLHIVLGDSSYVYSSSDDTIWYSVIDAVKLKTDIEKVLS